eukprot:jgi/Botrbrau1/21695/Bobra.43_1s0091.1
MGGVGPLQFCFILVFCITCHAILENTDDSASALPDVEDPRPAFPDRRDITDLTDTDNGRNETAYELKILEKMEKMDSWVKNLSAGERTRIQEDLGLKLKWLDGNITVEEKRRLIKHKLEKAEKKRMDEWDLWEEMAKDMKSKRNVRGDRAGVVTIEDMNISKIPRPFEEDRHPGHKILYTSEGKRVNEGKGQNLLSDRLSLRMDPKSVSAPVWEAPVPSLDLPPSQDIFPATEEAMQRSWKAARPHAHDLTQYVG